MSRTDNVLRNFKFAVINYVVQNIMRFVIRTAIIYLLGKEFLGLNGLFTNILGVLNLAELGIGGAIVYSMYKPIAENNVEEVKALNNLYKKLYYIIAVIVLVVGLAVLPFLDVLVNTDKALGINYHVLYLIYLLNAVISYFAGHKRSLMVAYQRRDIEYKIHSVVTFVSNLVQCAILLIFKNYYLYVITMPIFTLIDIVIVIRVSHKYFPEIRGKSQPLKPEVKKEITKNVGAMSFHKLGDVIINSTDNIIISAFLGISVVGMYSNYLLITTTLTSLILLAVNSLQGSIGNFVATADVEYVYKKYKDFNFIFTWLGGFCSICLLCLFQDFILIWTSDSSYLIGFGSVILIALNFCMTCMRYMNNGFKVARGLMWNDRWRPIVRSLINIVVSLLLVKPLGLFGVLIGTVASFVLSSMWVDPYVVHKHYFKKPLSKYFAQYLFHWIVILIVGAGTFALTSLVDGTSIGGFILKAVICLFVINIAFVLAYFWMPEFKNVVNMAKSILFKKKQNKSKCVPKVNNKVKHIVFDMDGVIFDTEKYWSEAYKEASKVFNKDFDCRLRKNCCGRNSKDSIKIFAKKFPDIDAQEVRKFMTDYVDKSLKNKGVVIKTGFLELLEFLKKQNVKLALATGSELDVVEKYFNSVGLNVHDIFEAIVTGDKVKKAKPNPEVYLSACKLIGENPSDCIAIEDSPNGTESAGKAGLETFFVIDQIQPDEVVEKYAKNIFNNLLEVKEYFEKN